MKWVNAYFYNFTAFSFEISASIFYPFCIKCYSTLCYSYFMELDEIKNKILKNIKMCQPLFLGNKF